MKGVVKKIVNILSVISYIGIAIYAIACIPNFLGYKPLIVETGSMEPVYKVGSVIYCEKVDKDEINVNDVVTFKASNDLLITHRVVKIENDQITTKGDANQSVDPNKITYSDVEGRVKKLSMPYLGFYIQYINENTFIIALVVIILLFQYSLGNFRIIEGSIIDDEII